MRMEVAVVLANTSPSIVLGGGLEKLAKRLEEILPDLRRAAEELRRVEEKYCRPLLLVEPTELDSYFKSMLTPFTFDLIATMLPLSHSLFTRVVEERGFSVLMELKELEKELFAELRPLLEEAAREKKLDSEAVVRAYAAAIDYDLWLIDMVIEVGFHGFLDRLTERAGKVGEEFVGYLYALFYVIMSINSALLGGAPHREDTLKILVEWGSHYAREVEDYLDTLLFLIPDEEYEAVSEFLRELG